MSEFNSALNQNPVGNAYLAALEKQFPSAILDSEWQTDTQATVTIRLNWLPEVVEWLYYQQGGWLSVLFGNDERTLCGNYALYYVLSMEKGVKCWITVRAEVDPVSLEFPSVTPRVPAAVWGEREVRDMYGLRPIGLPDERRLVLPDDWHDDLYPLRKDAMDYRQRPAPTTDEETYPFISEAKEGSKIVPIGPLHVTSDEPGHFRLFVDGEDIIDADYRLFYVHRGMEKLAETRMGYNEVTFLSDRVCGICGFTHSVAYTSSVENAMGILVPERAQMIRSILLEVERLHSHLLNLGLACHFVGFDSGFMQFFRIREQSMKMAEILTGARKTYGMNLIGGIRRDILKDDMIATLALAGVMRRDLNELVDILLSTPNTEQRSIGVGILDPQVARDFSNVGPMVRGSGHRRDMRQCGICTACARSDCRTNAVWCCRMTGMMTCIRCAKTQWITVSARHRPRMKKPIRLFLRPKKAAKSCPLVRCTSLLTNRVTFVCSLMAKTLSTPIIGCSTCIAAWKNWPKPAWAITK